MRHCPNPLQEFCLDGESSPWGGRQRGTLLHGVSCTWGHTSFPHDMGLSNRGGGCITCSPCHSQGAPHQSNAVSEPAWPPAVSLQCRAAAEQRQTPALLPHRRSGAGSVGESRGTITLPRHHLPGHPAAVPLWGREACQAASVSQDCSTVCGNRQLRHWVGCGCSQLCTHLHTCSGHWVAFPLRGRLQRLLGHS